MKKLRINNANKVNYYLLATNYNTKSIEINVLKDR